MTDTITRTCLFCNATFEPKKDNAIYCSRSHKERAKSLRKTGYRRIYPKHCAACNIAYIGRNDRGIYCSDKCKRQRKQAKREQREKLLSTRTKSFRQNIYFRDKGLCGVCGEAILLTDKYPHPQSMTLDHIVPLSAGGAHAKYNIQLAHWICNINKSDKLIPSQTVTTPTPGAG